MDLYQQVPLGCKSEIQIHVTVNDGCPRWVVEDRGDGST